ncbi:MAG: D-alanine--D-alanine ligase [Acidiferrobacterales bacterium]
MNAAEFGKVVVLMGGRSAEREVSLNSGAAVLAALQRKGVDVHGLDVKDHYIEKLQQGDYDRAFNILHGTEGEDGIMQAVLQALDIPYTGSGVMASALSMDKLRSRYALRGAGLPTPKTIVVSNSSMLPQLPKELGLPLVIKPNAQGSSVGVRKVSDAKDLDEAYAEAARLDAIVLAEQWIGGKELHAAILGDRALPLIRVQAAGEFYDYEAKYLSNSTVYHCPSGLEEAQEKRVQQLALETFRVLGCRGWGRVDFLLDEQGEPYVLEMNTLPGMTDHSLVPMAAKQAGIEFDDLVIEILESSLG